MNKSTRQEVYSAIDGERDYQDSRWNAETTTSMNIHSPEEWIIYMEDYLAEAKHILLRVSNQRGVPQAMNILRKVAAMAVCAMEQGGVQRRVIQ